MQGVKAVNFRFKIARYPMTINVISDFYAAMTQLITHITHVMTV